MKESLTELPCVATSIHLPTASSFATRSTQMSVYFMQAMDIGYMPFETRFCHNDDLWHLFMQALPVQDRQYHNCTACRHFFRQYAGIIMVDVDDFSYRTLFSQVTEGYYGKVFKLLDKTLKAAMPLKPVVKIERQWGHDRTTDGAVWFHFHVRPSRTFHKMVTSLFKRFPLTSAPAIESKLVDLNDSLFNYLKSVNEKEIINAKLRLINSGLSRKDKLVPVLEKIHAMKVYQLKLLNKKGRTMFPNLAELSQDVLHFPASASATFIQDLRSMSIPGAIQKLQKMLDPTKYQRPQAAPAAGNVVAAEKLVAKLGLEKSLPRMYALAFSPYLTKHYTWRPKEITRRNEVEENVVSLGFTQPESKNIVGGVFNDIKTKSAHVVTYNWTIELFKAKLDTIALLYFMTKSTKEKYCALTEPAFKHSKPVLKWDKMGKRNPVAWYVYSGNSYATDWSLPIGHHVQVNGILPMPNCWDGDPTFHGLPDETILLLEGCEDKKIASNSLFPELLRPELREVRSTIEQYNRENLMHKSKKGPLAAGVILASGQTFKAVNIFGKVFNIHII